MAKTYHDHDADLSLIQAKKVAIIGYGSQGHAHALNLKDSGVEVNVGLPATSQSIAKAQKAGLEVLTVAEAAKWADVIMILAPGPVAGRDLHRSTSRRTWPRARLLLFAHGFNIHFKTIIPPADIDVEHGRAQGARPSRARSLHRRRRRSRPDRRPSGRDRQRARAGALLRQGHRLHARRRARDHLQGRDRNRSLRRAGGAVRRRQRAGQGRLRDAGRSRLLSRRSRTSSACTS